MQRLKKSFSLIGFLIIILHGFGQEGVRFKAFGHTPKTIPDTLYRALQEAKTTTERSHLLYHIGKEHQKYGDGDSVVQYANSLNKHIKTNTATLLKMHLLLGEGKLLKGLANDSQKAFLEGLASSGNPQHALLEKWLQLGLAKTYIATGEFLKSKNILKRLKAEKNDTIASKTLYLLAKISLYQKAYPSANTHLENASLRIASLDLPRPKMEIQLLLAQINHAMGNGDKALNTYSYLINDALNFKFFDIYTESVLGYGTIYREREAYEASEMTLSMAYTNAMNWNRGELQKKIIKSLTKTYTAKGDYKNAYALMTQYVAISNDILQKENKQVVRELEVKYNTLEKENEIYQLKETQQAKENEISRQKTIKMAFLYGFLALLLPIIALLYVYYQKLQTQSELNEKQEQLNSQKIAALLSQQELDLVQTSFSAQQEERLRIAKQLHDSIGGNLAGIKLQISHSKENDATSKLLMQQVNETYELVREISHDLTPKKFQQNNFTLLLGQYLQQIADNAKTSISFTSHPEAKINILSEKLKVEVYRILQELVTNCLKHANASTIEVLLNLIDGELQLIFEDDGIGFDPIVVKQGIGLKNLKNRTQSLHGAMHVDSTLNRGTVITVEIPIKSS